MENQRKVELLTLEVNDHRIIKVAKLDFAKWKNQGVIEVIGNIGNGKSTLLESLSAATTGSGHIKDKSLLEKGFKSEVCLMDGDHKVYMGIKVSEYKKGKNEGKPKFETYLYEYDSNGKVVKNPVLDGESMTAKEYSDMLSTALTFNMPAMFSKNQAEHRELIESLFAKELYDLGVDEILEAIKTKKENRDKARYECERNSAFMNHFNDEDYDENKLEKLKNIPIEPIETAIKELEVEKGIQLKTPEEAKEKRLTKIKEEGRLVVSNVRKLNEDREKKYKDYVGLKDFHSKDQDQKNLVWETIQSASIPADIEDKLCRVLDEWTEQINKKHEAYIKSDEIKKPILIPIENDAIDISMIEEIPEVYKGLMDKRKEIASRYNAEKIKPIDPKEIDTKEIDDKLEKKDSEKKVADHNNKLVERFAMWRDWIDKKGMYEAEVDKLRKLYTKISTGVEGLFIQPNLTDSGRLEIYLEYNGHHDPELFHNKDGELRRLYEYSASQNAITGVLLQAARLDKKPKALRLAVFDGANQTKSSKALLEKICQEKNLKLIIARTDDRTKLEDLEAGELIIENGTLLLNDGE